MGPASTAVSTSTAVPEEPMAYIVPVAATQPEPTQRCVMLTGLND